MEDKRVLGEFHAKISKAKILFDTTSATNQKLRREANQLQREYETLKNKRIETEDWERDADNRMHEMKDMQKMENDICRREAKELDELRANRKELERVKKICESDLMTKNLALEELIKRKEALQVIAKSLTEKLDNTVAQKNVLQQEYINTSKAIEKYDQTIKSLTNEIAYAREVITANTVPVHNAHLEDHNSSQDKIIS